MSANNYILIEWKKDHYETTHRDAETNQVFDRIADQRTLEDAVHYANDFIEESAFVGNPIEYGLVIKPRPKNASAIGRVVQR